MKKSLLALAMFAMVGTAFADGASVSLDYQRQTVDNGSGPAQYQTSLQVKQKINDLITVDAGINAAQNENFAPGSSKNFKDSYRLEAGVTAQHAIYGPVDGYARLGIGQKAPSGTEAFAYNSEELGVIAHLPAGFDAKLGYRWRQAFDTDLNAGQTDTTRTTRMAVAYNIDKKNVIAINCDKVRADSANGGNQTAYHATYTYKF